MAGFGKYTKPRLVPCWCGGRFFEFKTADGTATYYKCPNNDPNNPERKCFYFKSPAEYMAQIIDNNLDMVPPPTQRAPKTAPASPTAFEQHLIQNLTPHFNSAASAYPSSFTTPNPSQWNYPTQNFVRKSQLEGSHNQYGYLLEAVPKGTSLQGVHDQYGYLLETVPKGTRVATKEQVDEVEQNIKDEVLGLDKTSREGNTAQSNMLLCFAAVLVAFFFYSLTR